MTINTQIINSRIIEVYESKKGYNKQVELARYFQLNPSTVSMLLNGGINWSADRFFTLCNYLNVRPSYFIHKNQSDKSGDKSIDITRKFDNEEIRKVWRLIRNNGFLQYKTDIISARCLAEMFNVGVLYIYYRDCNKDDSRCRHIKILLEDIVLLCEIYKVPIDEVWLYLNSTKIR